MMKGSPYGSVNETWDWWKYVVGQWTKLNHNPKINEVERWHLSYLHSEAALRTLASRLAIAAQAAGHKGKEITVRSYWIDASPQAAFDYTWAGKTSKDACELSDILFVTSSDEPNLFDHALLVQAKVISQERKLDASTCKVDNAGGSSSVSERNLLELSHSEKISLCTRRGGTHLGDFDLSLPPTKTVGLDHLAAYLVVSHPDKGAEIEKAGASAYELMWPSSRSSSTGIAANLGIVLEAMLLSSGKAPLASVPQNHRFFGRSLQEDEGWIRLVFYLYSTFLGSVASKKFRAAKGEDIAGIHEVTALSFASANHREEMNVEHDLLEFSRVEGLEKFAVSGGGGDDGSTEVSLPEKGGSLIVEIVLHKRGDSVNPLYPIHRNAMRKNMSLQPYWEQLLAKAVADNS